MKDLGFITDFINVILRLISDIPIHLNNAEIKPIKVSIQYINGKPIFDIEANTYKQYLTFCDLKFEPKTHVKQAIYKFDNGYSISVITPYDLFGSTYYCDEEHPYEVALLKDDAVFKLKNTSFEDGVKGFCTKQDVTNLMKEIQDYKQN